MLKYFLKRVLMLIPVILGLTFLIFTMMYLSPGDPGTAILGVSAGQEAIRQFNEEIGFYDPFLVRYGRFLLDLVQGSFGLSYQTGAPVMEEIAKRLPISIAIAASSMSFAAIFGVSLGVFSAVKQYSLADEFLRAFSVTIASVPAFWLLLMLILLFSIRMPLLPTYGADTWKHYILPMVSLGIPYAARQMRMTRSCMLETIRADYVRTVRAKGAPERDVIWKHSFKNALLPIVTQLCIQLGGLIGGAVVTESVFAMPGLGSYLTTAVNAKNVNSVLGAAVTIALVMSGTVLAADMLYAVIDPRVKAKYKG